MNKFFLVIILTIMINNSISCQNNSSLGKGYGFNLFDNTPVSKLAEAVESENILDIEKYVLKDKLPIDFQDSSFGSTLLKLALIRSKIKAAKTLLALGADPNLKSPIDDSSPFLSACANIDLIEKPSETLLLLLNYKADPNSKQIKNQAAEGQEKRMDTTTALEYLVKNGTLTEVKILIDHGANLNMYPINGLNSLITLAVIPGRLNILEYLLIDKKMQIPEYCVIRENGNQPPKKLTITDLLNEITLNGKEEVAKNNILNYLKSQNRK